MSLVEAAANVAAGFGINLCANLAVLPLFGLHPSLGDALGIGVVFTAIALVRSYALRRLFETVRVRNARTGE